MQASDARHDHAIDRRELARQQHVAVSLHRDRTHDPVGAQPRIEFVIRMPGRFVVQNGDDSVGRVAEHDRSGQRVCGRWRRARILQIHIENLVALARRIIIDPDADALVGFARLKYKLTAASGRGHPGIAAKFQRADLRVIIPLRAADRRTVAAGEIHAHRVHGAAGPADVKRGKPAVFDERIRRWTELQHALIVFDHDRCLTLGAGCAADGIGQHHGEPFVSFQQRVVADGNLDHFG